MYKIKEKASDFIVSEIFENIESIKNKKNGKYCIFLLKKENTTTIKAIEQISEKLGTGQKEINYCGLKDKNAITYQYISFNSKLKNKILDLNFENIKLDFVGFIDERLRLGQHTANHFEIIIRNLDDKKINIIDIIPNYFGEQRFSKNNIKIGKHIIKKEFKKAAELIAVDNNIAKEHLNNNPNDFIGTIKKINPKIITIYVHAFQGYIFNKILSHYIKTKYQNSTIINEYFGELVFSSKISNDCINTKFPLIGLDTINDEHIKIILKNEEIELRDFINRQISFLTVEETLRDGFVELKNLNVGDFLDDELNFGKKKITISFDLPKGSFATIAIRAMLSK